MRVEQIGPCTLYCADCLDVLPGLTGFDCVITDPPYGIARENHGGFAETRPMLRNDDTTAVGQAVVDWCESVGLPVAVFASPRKPWAGNWRNLIVWDKGGAVAGGGDMATCLKLSWELIQVARNPPICGVRDVSVWRHVVTPSDFNDHPTQKPVTLMERILEVLFGGCETVVDPCMGSGSTGVACINTGRAFTGFEIDPVYFDIAVQRIRRAWQEKQSELVFEPEPQHVQRSLLEVT